jgi:hypothetical protein
MGEQCDRPIEVKEGSQQSPPIVKVVETDPSMDKWVNLSGRWSNREIGRWRGRR